LPERPARDLASEVAAQVVGQDPSRVVWCRAQDHDLGGHAFEQSREVLALHDVSSVRLGLLVRRRGDRVELGEQTA